MEKNPFDTKVTLGLYVLRMKGNTVYCTSQQKCNISNTECMQRPLGQPKGYS